MLDAPVTPSLVVASDVHPFPNQRCRRRMSSPRTWGIGRRRRSDSDRGPDKGGDARKIGRRPEHACTDRFPGPRVSRPRCVLGAPTTVASPRGDADGRTTVRRPDEGPGRSNSHAPGCRRRRRGRRLHGRRAPGGGAKVGPVAYNLTCQQDGAKFFCQDQTTANQVTTCKSATSGCVCAKSKDSEAGPKCVQQPATGCPSRLNACYVNRDCATDEVCIDVSDCCPKHANRGKCVKKCPA